MSEAGSEFKFVQMSRHAAAVLNRVIAMSHHDNRRFTPLIECQQAARELRRQMVANELAIDVVTGLADGTHCLGAMTRLIDVMDKLGDSRRAEYQSTVQDPDCRFFSKPDYGKALLTAILRGRLVEGNGDVGKPNASGSAGDSDMSVLAFEYEGAITNGSTITRRQPGPDTDALLAAFDDDDDDVTDLDDGSGWIFDDIDDSPSSSQNGMNFGSPVSGILRSSKPSRGEIDSPRSIVSDASDESAQVNHDRPDEYFQFLMYGSDEDQNLLVPKAQLCLGWRFSEIILLEYYRNRCFNQRRRGFTSCCTDRFKDIAGRLGLPERRIREACISLELREQIVLIPNQRRECRVWLVDGYLTAAGQRPVVPESDSSAGGTTTSPSTIHTTEVPSLVPGLKRFVSSRPPVKKGM